MGMRNIRHIRCACKKIGLAWAWMSLFGTNVAFAAEGNTNIVPGIGLLRGIGIASALGGIVVLILVHFIYRNRLSRGTYHWLLLLGLFVLPITATLSTTATVMEGTKRVEACASCHVMSPFVNDLKNPASPTLAARHYKNNWIAKDQCYGCHITYGATGTIEGKRDGFRHWLYYVTGTYSDPIKFVGSYSNSNCLYCHSGTKKWERVKSHQALQADFQNDSIACIQYHGPPHPLPHERTLIAMK
ncbi:MAG: NapC/NirT family cytochrome c [Nitrospirales bacterium]